MASQINIQDLDLYLTINNDSTSSLSTTQPVSSISYTIVLKHFENNELLTIKWDKDNLSTLTTTGKITGSTGLKPGTSLFSLPSSFAEKTNTIKYNVADYATSPKSGSNEGTGSNVSSNDIIKTQDDNVYIDLMAAQNAMQQNNCYSMQIACTNGETSSDKCYVYFRGLVSDDITMGNIQVSISGVDEQTIGQSTFDSDQYIQVEIGATITITINSAQGYSFKEYSYTMGDVSQTSTNNTLSITVTDNVDIKFSFEQETPQTPDNPENPSRFVSLTIKGFRDDAWKVIATITKEEDIRYEEFTIDNITVDGIRKGSKITFEISNQSDSYYYYKGGLTDIESLDSNETLEVHFEEIKININSLEHWNITNLSGGNKANNIISNVIFDSTVSFDIVPDENYTFNNYTVSSNGSTQTFNSTHVTIEHIKYQCNLSVSLTKDHVTPDVVVSGDAEQKHYRFKVKYKNSDSEIWIDWYANVFNYITN